MNKEDEQILGKEMAELRLKIKDLENEDAGNQHIDNSLEITGLQRKLKQIEDKFIIANLYLVNSIANKYQNRGISKDELISEGDKELMRAVSNFDYTRGGKFSTYGKKCIEGVMKNCFRKKSKEDKRHADFQDDNFTETYVNESDRIVNKMAREETINRIFSKVKKIARKEKEVMERLLGVNGKPKLPPEAAGKELGISTERVILLKEKFLVKLEGFPDLYKEFSELFS